MKSKKNHFHKIFYLFLIIPFWLNLSACKTLSEKKFDVEAFIKSSKHRQFKNYNFKPSSPITGRIKTNPDFVLDFLKDLDKRPDYTLYSPNKKEIKIFKENINLLPPLLKSILQKKLLAVYFVNDFLGNGLTDWVVDKNHNVYAVIVFNSTVFSKNLATLVTDKEKSIYKNDDPSMSISIELDNKLSGFFYILTHEATHAVDYVMNLTPFVDKEYKYIKSQSAKSSEYTRDIWLNINKPEPVYDFAMRKKLSFYGMGKGPHISIKDAAMVYQGLASTPFASLYGSTSWAEDIVELVIFYHLTEVLKKKYIIKVFKNNQIIYSYEPMKNKLVRARFKTLKRFYSQKH